jgi:ribonuclease J
MIEITAVGGYEEVGKNCTAINIDGTVIICDMGLHLEHYINFTESDEEDVLKVSGSALMKVGAVPDISIIDNIKKQVKAIIPTHAHLDHVGAIPFLSNRFSCDIFCTPFTAAVLRTILKDDEIELKNTIKVLNVNSIYHLTDEIKIEFINMTHSTPQTIMLAIHTKYGIIIYANDFKFDSTPIIGKKANIARLKELGKHGVLALICDSLYAENSVKTPSESVAQEMLKEVLLGTESNDNLILVTTFSSHLARLKSIIEIGRKLNRKIVLLGRSLAKYVHAGEDIGIIKFSDKVEIVKYGNKVGKKLIHLNDEKRKKYLLVVTGHQGEPKAVLSKIVDSHYNFKLKPGDHVVFSCKTIPTKTNLGNRDHLEKKLHSLGVRVFKDIHVSGHAGREDLRDLVKITKPKNILPAHGDIKMMKAMEVLAFEEGFEQKQIHLLRNGQKLVI